MAKTEKVIFICDANCNYEEDSTEFVDVVGDTIYEPVDGFWGMVSVFPGTESIDWFACRSSHIKGAILNVLNGARE